MTAQVVISQPQPVPPPKVVLFRYPPSGTLSNPSWDLSVADAVRLRDELNLALVDPRIAQQVQDAWGIVNH